MKAILKFDFQKSKQLHLENYKTYTKQTQICIWHFNTFFLKQAEIRESGTD